MKDLSILAPNILKLEIVFNWHSLIFLLTTVVAFICHQVSGTWQKCKIQCNMYGERILNFLIEILSMFSLHCI